MGRKAVLIEASAVPGQDPLPGAARDVDTLKSWLMSNPGGAWEEDEIEILRNPTVNLVRAHMVFARSTDYAFISFSGHGCHPNEGDFDDTEVALYDGCLRVYELNCGAARCGVVIDACRYVGPESFVESYQRAVGGVKLARDRTWEAHRQMFDSAVAAADKGVVYLFSCDITEFAGESPLTGGYFTRYLEPVIDLRVGFLGVFTRM